MEFTITEHFNLNSEALYKAWLDTDQHSNMTGGEAICSNVVGGEFSAWDGYISGVNKSLSTYTEIIQEWRTTEFAEGDENSLLTLHFKDTDTGCELILTHANIPQDQPDYKQGWIEHYFEPMKAYFEK